MKLLGIASFFLAVLCVCTVGGDDTPNSTTSAITSSTISKSVMESVKVPSTPATTSQTPVLTTTVRATNPSPTVSVTNGSVPSSSTATQKIRQGTTIQPPIEVNTTAVDKSDSTANATQKSETQSAQNESSDASSTKGWSSPTISLQNNTSTPGTPGFHMSSPTKLTTSGSPASTSGNDKAPRSDIHYSSVILPIVITLIVITLAVFSLVALYRMCQRKTPERQENGTEQAQSDKEGVKLLSVKTTSSETVFVEVRDIFEVGFSLPSANLSEPTAPPPSGEVSQGRTTGEHSSQGKSKTRQLFAPQQ